MLWLPAQEWFKHTCSHGSTVAYLLGPALSQSQVYKHTLTHVLSHLLTLAHTPLNNNNNNNNNERTKLCFCKNNKRRIIINNNNNNNNNNNSKSKQPTPLHTHSDATNLMPSDQVLFEGYVEKLAQYADISQESLGFLVLDFRL